MGELCPGSARWQEREWLRGQPAEWWDDVFDRIACGESAARVVREGYCVRVAMFLRVLDEDEGRRGEYEAALRIAADGDVHDVVEIADTEGGDVARDKLRIEARRWRASKWNRERYGEKVDVRHGGVVGGLTIVLAQLAPAEQEKVISPEREVLALGDETGTAAGEGADTATPAGPPSLVNPPRQAVPVAWDI